MKKFIMKLANDFNEYSELVAMNYAQKKEGKCDEGTFNGTGDIYHRLKIT